MIKKGSRVKVLTGKNKRKEGEIIETNPISKTKKFKVIESNK